MKSKCVRCRVKAELIPFVKINPDPNYPYSESDFIHLCSSCHYAAAKKREMDEENLPYWFKVSLDLRDVTPIPWQPPIKPVKKAKPQLELMLTNAPA